MKATTLPSNCSAVSVAERPHGLGGQIPTDLRLLAIQSLEANPNFRGRLVLGAIHIAQDGDTLLVQGRVPSYYLKQLLQETLRRVDGVARIQNQVEVVNSNGQLSTG